jgi:hypothetical protein
LRFVRRFNTELLVFVEVNVFSAFDDDCADAECSADASADRSADRTAGNRADDQARAGRCADFNRIFFHCPPAFDRAFRINAIDVIAFSRHNIGDNSAEIAPPSFRQHDAVKREQHFRAPFDPSRFLNFRNSAFDYRAANFRRRDNSGFEAVAFLIALRINIVKQFDD